MFSLFRKKKQIYSLQEIVHELGASDGFNEILSAGNEDIVVATRGMAEIIPTITEAKKCFDLDVRPDSIFAKYLAAFQAEDLSTMASMTRDMVDMLESITEPDFRGLIIYSWFSGDQILPDGQPPRA